MKPIAARTPSRACPDCPAPRAGVLEVLVDRPSGCAFRCLPVPAREQLPMAWRGEFSFALVRRGIVVRQRVSSAGHVTAIDIAGPASAIPMNADGAWVGYAVDDALFCLVPKPALDTALAEIPICGVDVVRSLGTVLDRVERIAEARSRSSADARVASLLLAISDTLCPGQRLAVIPSSIQQRDMAALLAMRHESVCRTLAQLASSGLVRRADEGTHLIDRAGLEAIE